MSFRSVKTLTHFFPLRFSCFHLKVIFVINEKKAIHLSCSPDFTTFFKAFKLIFSDFCFPYSCFEVIGFCLWLSFHPSVKFWLTFQIIATVFHYTLLFAWVLSLIVESCFDTIQVFSILYLFSFMISQFLRKFQGISILFYQV